MTVQLSREESPDSMTSNHHTIQMTQNGESQVLSTHHAVLRNLCSCREDATDGKNAKTRWSDQLHAEVLSSTFVPRSCAFQSTPPLRESLPAHAAKMRSDTAWRNHRLNSSDSNNLKRHTCNHNTTATTKIQPTTKNSDLNELEIISEKTLVSGEDWNAQEPGSHERNITAHAQRTLAPSTSELLVSLCLLVEVCHSPSWHAVLHLTCHRNVYMVVVITLGNAVRVSCCVRFESFVPAVRTFGRRCTNTELENGE